MFQSKTLVDFKFIKCHNCRNVLFLFVLHIASYKVTFAFEEVTSTPFFIKKNNYFSTQKSKKGTEIVQQLYKSEFLKKNRIIFKK